MKNSSDKKIFISYRVQDTAGETGRLVDALKHHFDDDQLFMDIENLEPGADFTEAISRSLSICDVVLVVIGPRWTGPREGQPPRIQEENDWVRLEVATALQRNVRVVPLLVDGGSLPRLEDLPPDLQPLLRRQSMEISNKRWRYDTEQLISFLVNTAGITPRRFTQEKRTVAETPKKSRTWLYVAGGFGLALALMIGLALMVDDEPTKDLPTGTTGGSTTTSQVVPANTTTTASSTAADADIGGTWQEVDEGLTTTFYFTQSGTQVNISAQLGGQEIGGGTGTVSGNQVNLNVTLLSIPTQLQGSLSPDGQRIEGIYTVPATGESTGFKLVRK
jgi:hypothetical protein